MWKAGHHKLTALATKKAPRRCQVGLHIFAALDELTVTVLGSSAADTVPPRLADSLKAVLTQRAAVASEAGRSSVRTLLPGS
ncbi:hypothetical protein FB384_003374 [Prauserella sediminis]|uniref:Uncharacterized protein n=1 Tax=Prauserella sediminis TaxID=577680 RepID=A0A839XMH0_9PSEU|nr:hypothetical protein [Prauserella sediminis]